MLCVQTDANGFFYVVSPQPADVSACTAVVISGVESSQLGSIFQPMTAQEGATIGTAIWGAWAVAWGFRILIRQAGSLSTDGGSHSE